MDSNQATSQLSSSPSGSSSLSSIQTPHLYSSEIDPFVENNALKTDEIKPNKSSSSSSSSSYSSCSDDGGFASGEEKFETALERPVLADPDEETLDNDIEGENTGEVFVVSSESLTTKSGIPVADDDVENGPKVRVLREGYVESDGTVTLESGGVEGMGASSLVGDGATDFVESDEVGAQKFSGKAETIIGPISGKNLNLNLEVEGGLGVPQEVTAEVSVGSEEDEVVEISKLDEVASSVIEGSLVPEEAAMMEETELKYKNTEVAAMEEAELRAKDCDEVVMEVTKFKDHNAEDKKSEALNDEDSVTAVETKGSAEAVEESTVLSHDREQINDEILESANSKLVEADGVKFNNEGNSTVEPIGANRLEPGVAVVDEAEFYEELVHGPDQTVHVVENDDDADFEKNIETSTHHNYEVEESESSGVKEPKQEDDFEAKQNENVVKIAADGDENVSTKGIDGADGVQVQALDFGDESPLSNQAHKETHLESVDPLDDGLAEWISSRSRFFGSGKLSSSQNSQVILEAEDEVENPTDEGEVVGGLASDGETDGMIFGSSEAAKQFIEELEQGSAGSHSGAESFHDQPQRSTDGQIVTDSDEEVDTDEEGDGKELFDSAALTALLKAATGGAGSDSGNITITSQDGSRLFSIERPAGLGSSVRSFKPVTRPNRSNLFASSGLTTGGESEDNLSEEDKKKLEKLQLVRVKFLRLVQRLGISPDESVAAQVLYRLALVSGRQTSQTFSLDADKRTAIQLEAEGKVDLDFSVNILVLGKSGVGKSATINSIFGEEKSSIDAFEPSTTTVKEISGIVNGVKIKVFDTPGLKSAVMEQAFNRRVLSSITKFTKKSPPDIVLYVDRLDSQTRDLNDLPLLKTITASLGPSIWRSAIVTLTHAASAPPDGPSGSPLSYEVFVTQRSHIVQQSIGHAVGDLRMMSPSLMNPVSLAENHRLCRKNREGQKVLPNGQTWRPQLLLLCYSMKILSEASSLSKPQDPFDHRKLFGFRGRSPPLPYILSSMLQTRAHPNLSSDQGIENGGSDIDLEDLSDSDQEEEEEDEYDQLPPFKPLRKSQISKLSKEQKKAYFEEYDYRVKLLNKKQWRAELKRMREMKRKGKDAENEYGFMEEDADQENGSAAPVSTPLPDMVLPPSFDSDSPVYRYRFLEPTSQFLARPVLDTHGWDHDCGYDGVNLEQSLAIASRFPAAIALQITKDKKDFSIHLDSSVSAKHGENGSSMAGFDIQTIGKQLAYIVRGETKFKNMKKNKTAAGISITFLGENVAPGLKIEDQIKWGKQWALVGSAGTVRCQGDAAYGANLELQRRELDYPIGQVQSTYGLSLIKWRGDWALGFNTVAQFSIGRSSKVALRAGINNKLSGQITVRTSSSEHLPIALAAIIPIASAIYKKIWPAVGDNYSIY
ncbi:hypothetical protein U1Q18_034293 [Sarracenia purpurea var. burkii]